MPAYSQANHSTSSGGRRATLVIAHPGHELRVHGWLETARADVCVLTDGSGRTQHSRIDSTTRVLEASLLEHAISQNRLRARFHGVDLERLRPGEPRDVIEEFSGRKASHPSEENLAVNKLLSPVARIARRNRGVNHS